MTQDGRRRWKQIRDKAERNRRAYCLTADIRMPDLGVELYYRRLEGIVFGDPDVNGECAAGVGSVGRRWEAALEVGEVPVIGMVGHDA